MTVLPFPTELILLSPHSGADAAFHDLARRLESLVTPVPVRIARVAGSGEAGPLPGAALVTGGRPEALEYLGSISGDGWRWVHLTGSGPDPFHGLGPVPGDPVLTYSRGVNARTMAEWVLAAVLHFYRDLDHYARSSVQGQWDRLWARELSGATLVVLGAGAAGSETARLASALGMRTVGVSLEGVPLPGFDEMRSSQETDLVLPEGDVTVVLLPLTSATRGSFGSRRVEALREGSILVVASRGGIVDEGAVLAAVREGRLRGAAFDVFAEEPLPPDSLLWREPGILVTPHVAGTSDRFMEHTIRILATIWEALFKVGDAETLARYQHSRKTGN